MRKKIIWSLIIFLIVGECLIRFDEKYKLFEDNKVVKINTVLEITPEYEMLKSNAINLAGNNLRIMVLGDSYIHGGGIEFKYNFSQQLKLDLQKENVKFENIYVLDLSKPNSNNFDNYETYLQFFDRFKPHIVILGYNYNDVMGNLNKQVKMIKIDSFTNKDPSSYEKLSIIQQFYKIIYLSRLVHYILHNVHTELKTKGIVISNSEFDANMKAYYENRENWITSKVILQDIMHNCAENNTKLIVLKFPEVNLLEYPEIFAKADTAIAEFFHKSPEVYYINGAEIFKGEKSKENIISKYDGHPNARAHKKMAAYVSALIKNILPLR